MDFLKKNWSKLTIAVLTAIGAILYFILLVTAPEFNFMAALSMIGPFLFFLGICAYTICKMFDATKGISKWILLGTGVLVSIVMIIGLFDYFANEPKGAFAGMYKSFKDMKVLEGMTWAANMYMFQYIAQIIVFGLIPLIRGLKKLFHKESAVTTAAK